MEDSDESLCLLSRPTRTIHIAGDINQKTLVRFRRNLGILELADRAPVVVEINSEGGHIESGLAIADTILLSRCDVTTRVTGAAYSMASVILASGKRREALPNSRIMLHEASFSVDNRISVVASDYKEVLEVDAMTWDLVDKATGKPSGFWKDRCNNTNLYLSANQALELGLIDRICR